MASIEELKQRIDLHDLADKLGLSRPGDRGNYRSPHHEDKSPSLSIFQKGDQWAWKDHSQDVGGSCIDLVCYVKDMDVAEAVVYLHDLYGFPLDKRQDKPQQPKTRIEYIADQCRDKPNETKKAKLAIDYLKSRGITETVATDAVKRGSVGWNDWTSPKIEPNNPGHGGAACTFIVKNMHTMQVVAVDMRYIDKALNGGVKTQCQGEKYGFIWFDSIQSVKKSHTIYVVESPINALSVISTGMKNTSAVAVRGVNVAAIDWSFLAGKRVILCFDNDTPDERGGRPGPEAAWKLHSLLLGMNIAAFLVDQSDWEHNDVNDIIKVDGKESLYSALRKFEPWVIPGLPGNVTEYRSRLYLPPHDFRLYWRFRAKEDFTTFIEERKEDSDGQEIESFDDLCGFRVAGISRVTIASATATMTGENDSQPNTVFSVSVQTPRHGDRLIRRIFEDEKLHNTDQWQKFGPIYHKRNFSRMINILERASLIGGRDAANFVGLCWQNGKIIVNEGADTFFSEPDKQCPYHNLTFPNGSKYDAKQVIQAYQQTFQQNAATLLLVWSLGAHLKAFLGFWPHMELQSDKGAGKSTLIKRLERSIAFQMLSGQSLQTEFRLLTSISHTSHPIGWEELSARRQDIIDKAVGMLQENYQYTVSRRGADMTEYVLSAPVLLAGEDVPVRALTGKLVRTNLLDKGPLLPEDLPRFPVKQWLDFLALKSKFEINETYKKARQYALDNSRATKEDNGAVRMSGNYAALMAAWKLLCEFSDTPFEQGNFIADCIAGMNSHISETSSDREPWVLIVETILSEIDSGRYLHPYVYDEFSPVPGEDKIEVLYIRTGHMMDHISHNPALRDKWNALSVKSDRVFKKQCKKAGVIVREGVEKVVRTKRIAHLVGFDIKALAQFGLYTSAPEHFSVQ